MVRKRFEKNLLNEGDLGQISGMGQNPTKLFDNPHPKYQAKDTFHPFDSVEVSCLIKY